METALDVGQMAPDVTLRGEGGQPVTLSEYRGRKNVVLVFYPLAFSPVCSHQLPEIQKQLGRLESHDAVVLGVSIDSHYANTEFARRLGVTFPLLSDLRHEATRAYGVFLSDRNYGGRAIFVIDKQGRLAYRDVAPNPSEVPALDPVVATLASLS